MKLETRPARLSTVFSGDRRENAGSGGARRAGILTACLLMVIATAPAAADQITLIDGNSTVQIDTGTAFGLFGWTVNGVNHASTQTTWYRVGATDPESLVQSLQQASLTVAGNTANVQYAHDRFTIDATYVTNGGTPGTASISEIYTITNTAGGLLDLHLFQYSDFDVDGEFNSNLVSITGGNTATQTGPLGSTLTSIAGGRTPSRFAAAPHSQLLDGFTDLTPTTLGNLAGPVSGDGTHAFQWDLSLVGAGASTQLRFDMSLVPEPTALLLLAAGMALVSGRNHGIRRRIGQ